MKRLTFLSALLALVLTLTGCGQERAPASSFVLLDGSKISTEQMQGKVTLVNFWPWP
mgnify:CR=1 FL=1